jgi:starch synthase
MNIVQVSSELAPWSKAGGLGDVCGALPRALAARGHRVVTIAPMYGEYPEPWFLGVRGGAWLYGMHHTVGWYHTRIEGVDHLFVDHVSFKREGIYGDKTGAYGDNLFRFALLSRVALQVAELPLPDGGPIGEDVVFHVNDWHTALLPLFLDAGFRPAGRYLRAASVLALHNVSHHGSEDGAHFDALDLPARWRDTVSLGGRVNPMKAGISAADQLVTVSPTYAGEITQDQGFGLEDLLRARRADLHGVVNGVGPEWDPATDVRLPATYTAEDLSGKLVNKAALQRRFGLEERPEAPVFGFIGRLVHQKGVDLLASILPWLVHQGAQVVMLGSGQAGWETWMREAPAHHPGRVGSFVGYSEDLAHLITAGSDFLLMPSRFEPCGLNQLYALRYGTIPVVHGIGGLVDTVEPLDGAAGVGTGYRFTPFGIGPFRAALEAALGAWHHFPGVLDAARLRGMAQPLDWDTAAQAYERVYEAALERRRRFWSR